MNLPQRLTEFFQMISMLSVEEGPTADPHGLIRIDPVLQSRWRPFRMLFTNPRSRLDHDRLLLAQSRTLHQSHVPIGFGSFRKPAIRVLFVSGLRTRIAGLRKLPKPIGT